MFLNDFLMGTMAHSKKMAFLNPFCIQYLYQRAM